MLSKKTRCPESSYCPLYMCSCNGLCLNVVCHILQLKRKRGPRFSYTHAHARTCTHARTHARAHTHAYIHTYIHAYIHTYIHTYVHTYIHTHIHTYIYIYIYLHIRIRIRIHTHMHIRTHIHYIHTLYCLRFLRKAAELAKTNNTKPYV